MTNANPASYVIAGDAVITATFAELEDFTLDITVLGNGSVTKSPDQAIYQTGSLVDLTAAADANWQFDGWSGDLSGANLAEQVSMNASKAITATFTLIPTYTLSSATVGNGLINLAPQQASYQEGTIVTATATALTGWQFDGWSGDLSGTTSPHTMTLLADSVITATFSQVITHTLTTGVVGNGSITVVPDRRFISMGR